MALEVQERDIFEVIATTRAIRRLKPDPVPPEYVERILWAGTRGPSGGNRQPWRFVAIDDKEVIRKLALLYEHGWEIYMRDTIGNGNPDRKRPPEQVAAIARNLKSAQYLAAHIAQVPLLIMVCVAGVEPSAAGGAVYPAIQNMTLTARALGLGSSITTVLRHSQREVRDILKIPDNASYIALLPIGWPLGRFGSGPRKPVPAVAFHNVWGEPWALQDSAMAALASSEDLLRADGHR